jgi:hypothetical protein
VQLSEWIERIEGPADLAQFVEMLRRDLVARGEGWENPTLELFLGAMAAWIRDMDGWFLNRGTDVPDQPDWSLVGHMLMAASVYE